MGDEDVNSSCKDANFDMQVTTVAVWKTTAFKNLRIAISMSHIMCDTHLWFDYQKMEGPGNLHHPPVPQDMRRTELRQGWSLDLPHNLEQMLHLCLVEIVEMQTKHILPVRQHKKRIKI